MFDLSGRVIGVLPIMSQARLAAGRSLRGRLLAEATRD